MTSASGFLTDPFPPVLPDGWAARVPTEADVPAVVALLRADARRTDPDGVVDEEQVASRLVGVRSWSRRQVVIVPRDRPGSAPVAWVDCEDRAAGRTNVQWVVVEGAGADGAAGGAPLDPAPLAESLLDWADAVGGGFARHRGVEATMMNAGTEDGDAWREERLAAHGYRRARIWLHMERPVTADEARSHVGTREGVRVRPVLTHASGLPVAQDVRTVHRMLEESFADHFNSYRESFAEFAARLVESPRNLWDHWWIAEVRQEDGSWLPGGGLVSAPMPATPTKGEGTYLEYLGVHRSARGRGVAKALLATAIRDAAERGRTRVGLEVDADSPTGADGLYRSLGWVEESRSHTWHREVPALPSPLVGEG